MKEITRPRSDPPPAPSANISPLAVHEGEESHADRDTSTRISDLVRRARKGDGDAFAHIYRNYRGAIAKVARVHLGVDVEDAVAETFVRAWKGLPRYRSRNGVPFSAWLYGIARNVVKEELRARRRAEPRDHLPERAQAGPDETAMMLVKGLALLPEEQRQVLELKYLLGLDNADIAAALGKSPGAVNAQRWRALRELRRVMER